jgi:hypothetical protein
MKSLLMPSKTVILVTYSIDYLASVFIPCRANANSLVGFWGQNGTDAHHN